MAYIDFAHFASMYTAAAQSAFIVCNGYIFLCQYHNNKINSCRANVNSCCNPHGLGKCLNKLRLKSEEGKWCVTLSVWSASLTGGNVLCISWQTADTFCLCGLEDMLSPSVLHFVLGNPLMGGICTKTKNKRVGSSHSAASNRRAFLVDLFLLVSRCVTRVCDDSRLYFLFNVMVIPASETSPRQKGFKNSFSRVVFVIVAVLFWKWMGSRHIYTIPLSEASSPGCPRRRCLGAGLLTTQCFHRDRQWVVLLTHLMRRRFILTSDFAQPRLKPRLAEQV